LAWSTAEFSILPQFSPGSGAQGKWDTRNIDHAFNRACKDVFRPLEVDLQSSPPEVEGKMMDNICSMICRRIFSTGTDPAIAQRFKHPPSFDEDFLDYVLEELIQLPNNSFNYLISFVAATEDSM
jgi:hypothetical protein